MNSFFMALVLQGTSHEQQFCKLSYLAIFKYESLFNLLSLIISMILVVKVKSIRPQIERHNFGWFDLMYLTIKSRYTYIILFVIDITNLILTITATVSYNSGSGMEKWECMEEFPALTMYMFVHIVMGYCLIFRMLITQLHYNFGS